jgi:hypothetical protein
MKPRLRSLVFGLIFAAVVLVIITVMRGLFYAWDDVSYAKYWSEKAVLFVVMSLFFMGVHQGLRPDRND